MTIELFLLGTIFVLALILLKKNFYHALSVLLVVSVLLHKEVFSIYKWDFLPVRFFMLAFGLYGVLAFLKWFAQHKSLRKVYEQLNDPFILLLGSIWLVRGVSILFSKNLQASILLFGFFSTIVVLGYLLYFKLRNKPDLIMGYIKKYIFIALGLVFFGFFQLYLYTQHEIIIGALWNVPGHVARIGSTFWDVNHFAALLASLLPILGVLILLEGPMKRKVAYSAMFATMTGMLLLTSSRTSWIIALVSFLSFITLLLIRKFGKKGIAIILGALILIAIPLVREYNIKSSPFRAYVKDTFHYRLDSFASHLMLLQGSYQIFEEYPILGGGYGSFFEHFRKTDISDEFFGRDPAALNTRVPAHTIWGEAMSETGVVGLSLFVMFVLLVSSVMLYGFFTKKEKKDFLMMNAMFSTFIGILTAGIFYSYNSEFFWLVLFLYFLYALSVVGIGKDVSYKEVFTYFLKRSEFYFLIVAIISFLLIFVGLGSTHLIPWDEAIYSRIARNILETGDFINLYWKKGIIWFEKPPFAMWSMAISMKYLGVSSFATRLPSALFGFGTVLLTYKLGHKLYGRLAAYFAGLSLVLGVTFLYYSRAAMIDVTTTFFVTAGIYVYFKLLEKNNKKLWFLTGLLIGFAVITKGVIGLIPLVIIGLSELFTRGKLKTIFSAKNLANYGVLVAGLLLVSVPWHLVMYLRYGEAFFQNYFIYHVISRATEAIEQKGQPFYWYFIVMKVSMRIWFIPLLLAVPLFLYKSLSRKPKYLVFTIWFVFTFLLFSSASSKIVWYILPIYPAASLMVGYIIQEIYNWLATKIHHLDDKVFEFLAIFVVTVFALMYFFYNRHLVYTGDLTGSQAAMLQLKDKELGTEDVVYVDRIDLPIVMYYTDGPFQIIDYAPHKLRAPLQNYDKKVILISKKGRYEADPDYYGNPKVVGEAGDYILVYYEAQLDLDEKRVKDILKEIRKQISSPFPDQVLINELRLEQAELEENIKGWEVLQKSLPSS